MKPPAKPVLAWAMLSADGTRPVQVFFTRKVPPSASAGANAVGKGKQQYTDARCDAESHTSTATQRMSYVGWGFKLTMPSGGTVNVMADSLDDLETAFDLLSDGWK